MSRQRLVHWLSNRSIQKKLILAFGAVLSTFAITVTAILVALGAQTRAHEWSQHTRELVQQTRAASHGLHDADLILRGYVMTGDEALLPSYRDSVRTAKEHLSAAAVLANDSPDQQTLFQRVRNKIDQWDDDAAKTAVDATRAAYGKDGFDAATYYIGLKYLKAAETPIRDFDATLDQVLANEEGQLAQRDADLVQAMHLLRYLAVSMLVLGILAGLAAIGLASRSLTQPIQTMTALMTRLAEKDHSIEVPGQERRDEIGSIARALQVFRQTAIETERRNWVKTSITEIASMLQSIGERQAFANRLTSELAPRVKAGVAAFYAYDADEQRLDLLGSYGLLHRKHLGTRYGLGEGLVGQVALERKPIVLEQVPDDYVTIHSGLGEAPPRSIVALPLLLQDKLLGVVELGTFEPFDPGRLALIDELMPLAALSLENLNRAVRTQELLQHTQMQARELQTSEEELRVQQEELAATNEELHAKTVELEEQQKQLRTSEEQLRVQTEELQATNEELREKSETLNEQKRVLETLQRDTEHKAEQLARASQYKSDFLANMSHELRTPLNSLLILSRSLADNDSGNLSFDQIESARVIHESGTNLLRLINDILDLAKIEAGKMQVSPEPLQVGYFAQMLSRHFKHVAGEKLLEFDVEVCDDAPTAVFTDGARLEQIANNLIGNAFKFTQHGNVQVRFSRPAAEIAAKAGLAAELALAIAVRDTGIGIPCDKLDHIFGTFEQMDASTSRKYGGSGLGLPISRQLARLLGGDIFVESEPGSGSVFTVVVAEHLAGGADPLENETSKPIESKPPPTPLTSTPGEPVDRRLPPERMPKPWIPDDRDQFSDGDSVILAIEDDPVFARTLVDMIRRKGCRALAAGDGESGLYLARQYRPTGILLDVMLPGIDGWAVIEHLKQDPATAHIPVHFVSGVDETARAEKLGAVGFLKKPAERDAVLAAFERLLRSGDGGRRRVLLVDDDSDSRIAIATLIDDDNVEIVEATSAESALQYLDSYSFDCIVLDLGLPGMSGLDFLEVSSARGPLPPIVIHSGRELSREESNKLRQYTDSIVIKGARSLERLLDEVSLFLHSVRRNAGPHVPRDLDSSLSGHAVLIVDDDMRNIFALSKILREKGLLVIMAQDGHKALRQLEENKSIEIVLMDIMMPGMDGYETMREIRKQPRYAKLPIIAVTAKAMSGDRDRCLEAGANDYLTKPIDVGKLLSMMRTWMHA